MELVLLKKTLELLHQLQNNSMLLFPTIPQTRLLVDYLHAYVATYHIAGFYSNIILSDGGSLIK